MAGASLLAGCGEHDRGATAARRVCPLLPREPVRAVWVARMHYRLPDDVRTIIRNCHRLGCNTILWQVRGNATVSYPSQIEPWSREFGHRDPGFDPLALAVEEAHRYGMRLEAWVNVLPGWQGEIPPPLRTHLHYTHPEWFLHDAHGRRQPLGDFYVLLNPCLPAVRQHIVSVMEEIATRYAVDGLHLDYARYAWDTTPNAKQLYPQDAATVALYQRQTGRRLDPHSASWDHWRGAQLTRLVAEIRGMLSRRRPTATLTAAVVADPGRAYRDYLQNGVAWLRSGLLDAVMPMAYTTELADWEEYVQAYRRLAPRSRIVPGLGIYKHDDPEQMRSQLHRCMEWGGDYALFSYDSLHATAGDRDRRPTAARQAARHARRSVLLESAPR
ncbi:MAG: family 10 glycosylhydrolase [Planctomycetes bacterium]|nr:family 10 glycosylhydrolase [Planctomycetota bacterium]